MAYTYVTGDGWQVLLTTEPSGSEAVAVLDQAVRQIKSFIVDETNGVGKLLGSAGEIKTLVIGTTLPTTAAGDRYWFYSTSLNGIYFCNGATVLPFMPTGGAAAGKVLTAAGAGVLPVWQSSVPVSVTLGCTGWTTPFTKTGSFTEVELTMTGSATGVAVTSGDLVITTGYTVRITGAVLQANGNQDWTTRISRTSGSPAVLQTGFSTGEDSVGYNKAELYDLFVTNDTDSNMTLQLQYSTTQDGTAASEQVRFTVIVYPN